MRLGDVIARMAVNLSLETAAFEKGANIAEKRMAQTQRKFKMLGKQMSGIGRNMSIAVTAPLAAIGVSAAKAAIASRDAIGQMEATLASMGDGAGRSSAQLQMLAKDLESISAYDDKEILREVTSNMLTFGDIAGENFDRANKAAVNLSAKLNQDLKSSTILIGKALNDPVKGLSALSRVGVKLAPEQEELAKKMAEAGDIAGAQGIILAELEKQYEGSAKAVRDAAPGSETLNKWSDVQEKIGDMILIVADKLMPVLNRVLDSFLNLSPGMQKVVVITAALVAAVGPVLIVMGSLVGSIGTLLPLLAKLGPLLTVVRVAALALMANPVILAFAAVIAGIYLAWQNWDKIKPIVDRVKQAVVDFWNKHVGPVFNYIKDGLVKAVTFWWNMHTGVLKAVAALVQGVGRWLRDKLGAVWKFVTDKIETVKNAFRDLYVAVVGNSYIPDMVEGIAREMARLDALMVKPAEKAAKDTKEAFRELAQDVRDILDELYPDVAASFALRDRIARLREGEAAGLFSSEESARNARLDAARAAGGPAPVSGFLTGNTPLVTGVQEAAQRATDAVTKTLETTKEGFTRIEELAGSAFSELGFQLRGLVTGAQSAGDAIRNLAMRMAEMLFDNAFGSFGSFLGIPGFAAGTTSAPRGLALVGERGPELVRFRGGERVFNNSESREMMGRGMGGITVYANDADSFMRSRRQIAREYDRRFG